jgi:NTP pyrophosphatase (non-canonical NTP hydrolase)
MNLREIIERAVEVKKKYNDLEMKQFGKTWTNSQIVQGFVGDVGDLMKIIMAKEGIRKMDNVDEKLAHELADCLYCVALLSQKYGVDLEKAFQENMKEMEERILKESAEL